MTKVFRPRGVEKDGLKYYQERSGDYLSINPESEEYGVFEGRAAAIIHLPGSICTTGIHILYLKNTCKRVRKEDIPTEWRELLAMEGIEE